MNIKKQLIFVVANVFLLYSFIIRAEANKPYSDFGERKIYFSVESGYGWSLLPGLEVNENPNSISGFVWDHPTNGWDSKLGNTFNYGFAIGYNLSELTSLELVYNRRPSFQYDKAQIVPTSSAIGNRNRYFDLQNQTIMLNSIIHLASISTALKSFKDNHKIEPFVNLGLGVAENTISNFYSQGTGVAPGVIFSKMANKTTYNFAAQAGLGLIYQFTTNWSLKAGYRFLYGGNFKTQDYILDDPDNAHPTIPGSGNTVNSWKGTLKANEVYLGLTYTL